MKTRILKRLQSPAHVRLILLVYWALLATGSHLPSLGVGEDNNQFGMFQVDKTLHVTAFAGLTLLLFLARPRGPGSTPFANALTAACIGCIYALVDEYTQQWTGRDITLSDVAAGYIGILGVFLVLTAPPRQHPPDRLTLTLRIATAVTMLGSLVITFVVRITPAGHFFATNAITLMIALSFPSRPGLAATFLAVGLSGPITETAMLYTGAEAGMASLYAHQLGLLTAMAVLAALTVARNIINKRPA